MKKYLKKTYAYLLIAVFVSFITIILDLYTSINIGGMIDGAISKDKTVFLSFAKRSIYCSLALLIVTILCNYLYNLYKLKATTNLKYNYIKRIFSKNINENQSQNIASYISGFTNEIGTIEKDYIENIFEIITDVLRLVATFILIISINVKLLIFMVLLGAVSTAIAMVSSIFMKKLYKKRSGLNEELSIYIREILNTFHIIKLNNISERIKGIYHKKVVKVESENCKIGKLDTISSALQQLFSNVLFIGTYAIIVYYISKGNITIGSVFIIAKNLQYIINPIVAMTSRLPSFMSTKSVFSVLDNVSSSKNGAHETIDKSSLEQSIIFDNVCFSYDDKKILENVNLSFKKNNKYLIKGPSGCGKSTMLKLLKKYYTPQEGSIYIDNIDLNNIVPQSYYKCISNIEQSVYLFEDTLKNNITLYKEYSNDQIDEAINLSGLRKFVDTLKDKLETMILDNGKNISGGEKSRIAIARSLLMKSDVLIIDEAFANLDYETAANIENTILSIPDITVINVSHVIFESNSMLYDEVYVLDSVLN